MTGSIVCPRCGQDNDGAARFCNRCGAYIEQPSSAHDTPPVAPVSPSAPPWQAVPPTEPAEETVQSPARQTTFGHVTPAPIAPPAPIASTPQRAFAPTNRLMERLRSEDAERLVPRLIAASLVSSILALAAAGLVLLGGGAPRAGLVAVNSPSASRLATPVVAASPSPGPSGPPSVVPSSSPAVSVNPSVVSSPTAVPIPRDAETAARILVQAWLDRNSGTARSVASEEVVARLFARTASGAPTLQQCDNVGTNQWDCLFTEMRPPITVRVVRDGETFRVEDFGFV